MTPVKTTFIGTVEVVANGSSPLIEGDHAGAYMNIVCPAASVDAYLSQIREMAEYYSLRLIGCKDIMDLGTRFPDGVTDPLIIAKAREAVEADGPRIVRVHLFPMET